MSSTPTNFDYTGNIQTYKTSISGYYKLEVWGAQGGDARWVNETALMSGYAGKGGYSTGKILLAKDSTLYVVVGGRGGDASSYSYAAQAAGGYNGGGKGGTDKEEYPEGGGGGGGATHISTSSGLLSSLKSNRESIIIVAGGGGGGAMQERGGSNNVTYYSYPYGGYGGGLTGGTTVSWFYGGTQSCEENFGVGKDGFIGEVYSGGLYYQGTAGGGGGYCGGTYSNRLTNQQSAGGGGGSGYIKNSLIDSSTIAGNQVFKNPSGSNETGHSGNGYARITYLGTSI